MKRTYSNEILFIFHYVLLLLTGIAIGFSLLVLVYCIPTDIMQEHVVESDKILWNEGVHPVWFGGDENRLKWETSITPDKVLWNNRITTRDNFTDALMIGLAYYKGPLSESVVEKVLASEFTSFDGQDPLQSLHSLTLGIASRNPDRTLI